MSLTRDQLKAELIRRGVLAPDDGEQAARSQNAKDAIGLDRGPLDTVRDVAGGVMGGAQRLASTMGEAGQAIGNLAAPLRKYVPEWAKVVPNVNIREEMGLAGPNQVDLEKMISSDNPSRIAQGVGKYLPAIAAGGASIPGQMVANGLWGAVQAAPEQQNAGGYLPNGRIGGAVTDAALAGAGGVVGKELMAGAPNIRAAANYVGKKLDYLRPDKDAAEFLKNLGSGTKEENAQALARDIQQAHEANRADALSHKEPIYQQEAKTDIYKTPESALPEGNLDKVAYYIAPGVKPKPEQLQALGKEIANFRKGYYMEGKDKVPYSIDDLTHEAGNIFKTDLNQTQIDNLEHAMNVPTETTGKFRKMAETNPNLIEGNTRDLYDKFTKKPTLSNADALQSQLGDDYGYYKGLQERGKLEPALKPRLKQLSDLRNQLKDEMQAGLNRKNPAYGAEIDKFNQKYAENVVPYGKEEFTKNIVNEGKAIKDERAANPSTPYNITSGEAASYFANPTRAAVKVSEDIGEAGRKKILYNLLADETNPEAKGLANAILKAKQSQGYSRYITPEMETMANQLLKRTKWRTRAKIAGGLVGAGALTDAGYELTKKLIKG